MSLPGKVPTLGRWSRCRGWGYWGENVRREATDGGVGATHGGVWMTGTGGFAVLWYCGGMLSNTTSQVFFHYVYVLESLQDGKRYIGYTTHLKRRYVLMDGISMEVWMP
jgi:hypothetical protein